MTAAALLAAACFWQVPTDLPLPEANVVYLRADIDLEAGAELRLEGAFPHARQMGINIHARPSNATLASVPDTALAVAPGHTNPFRPGARRDSPRRDWALVIAPAAPAGLQHGRLGLGLPQDEPFQGRLLLRIYLPDAARPGGGVAMPAASKRSASGRWEPLDRFHFQWKRSQVGRSHLSNRMTVNSHAENALGGDCPTVVSLPQPQTPGPTRLPAVPGDVADPLDWRGSAIAAGTALADLLVNRDNAYAYAMTDFARGELLLLEGRAPRFPATRAGARRMGKGDVRYWSICAYVHPSNRTAACLADEDVPLRANRMYRIVVAPADRRPANARPECGMAFLAAPGAGAGALILRHVAPDPDFPHTPLHVEAGADASPVLGPYEPVGRYRSVSEIEALGCNGKAVSR